MPLYGTGYIFSRPFFRLWVVWTFAWAWAAALVVTLLPLWQGRSTLRLVLSNAFAFVKAAEPVSPGAATGEKQRSSEDEDEKKGGEDSATRVDVVPTGGQ